MRVRLAIVFALAAAASLAAPVRFQKARPVTPAGAGPNRLAVDVPLLAAARPLRFDGMGRVTAGLEDLRLFTANGAEVPYLVIAPAVPSPEWTNGRVLPILATEESSGFEVDLGSAQPVDRLRVVGLPTPFMKRLRLEGSGDRAHWTVLASEATLFDLPEDHLGRTELAFDRETLRYLRVTWDDRNSARVPAPTTVAARLATGTPAPLPTRVPITVERRPSEPGTSRFRLRLAGPRLPIRALELECGGGHLLRTARVTEPRFDNDEVVPRPLGTATLRRTVRDQLVAADLRIAIASPTEPELELTIDDGDNAPLDLQAVWAELASLPWVYFESADGAALTARFGDHSLTAPRYDLEAMRDGVRDATPPFASWGDVVTLAEAAAEPIDVGGGVPALGAVIDVTAFRHARAIPAGAPGLTALLLDAAVLARSPDLSDVRIVDAESRQIPYVVEHLEEPTTVELAPPAPRPTPPEGAPRRESLHQLTLPYEQLRGARLVLETSGRVFVRQVSLFTERPPADARAEPQLERLVTVPWRHGDPDTAAPALTIAVPPLETTTLVVGIDDGDNQPLPLVRPRLLLPTHRLRFVRSDAAPLTLVYGERDVSAPRYDLALLAPRLLGASATEVVAVPEEAGSSAPRAPKTADYERLVFWGALTIAVAVLLLVLARLLRSHEPAGSP